MFPLMAPLITGGMNLLGSMFSSEASASAMERNTQQQEQFNAGQAQINRDYQTQMSNTAYQRASADMKAAGLNPASMFGSGSAASSPGGAAASISMPQTGPGAMGGLSQLGASVEKAISTALAAKTMDKMTEEIANMRTNEALQTANTNVRQQELATAVENTKRAGAEADIATLAIPAARFRAKSAEDLLSMPEWLRSAANVGSFAGSKVSDTIAPIINSAGATARVMQGFEAIAQSKSRRKLDEGNFVGKYGVPIDEYMAQ